MPNESNPKDLMSRRGLLSLESLVSMLFIFESSEPRDVIYSLLAIARDTTPYAEITSANSDREALLMSTFAPFLERKPYIVDYSRSYVDVCKDFLDFCINRTSQTDPARALDILCCPWAPPLPGRKSIRVEEKESEKADRRNVMKQKEAEQRVPLYIPKRWRTEETRNALPDEEKQRAGKWMKLTEEEKLSVNEQKELLFKNPETREYWDKHLKDWTVPQELARKFPAKGGSQGESNGQSSSNGLSGHQTTTEELELPSWVSRTELAPYALFKSPGMPILKMGRKNADPLVGPPQDGYRNYSAAQTRAVDMEALKFRKRPKLEHYSLYVRGFILNKVVTVAPHSQGGNIPTAWTKMGGWEDAIWGQSEPPPSFWRTLVADRGKGNSNPPYYYARACKESVNKGGLRSGAVSTDALINKEQNSIIAEFCRRVQAVIWNRSLIRTEEKRLELVNEAVREGDLVCIIYGCTVPVIPRRKEPKTREDVEKENAEDAVESLKEAVRTCEANCVRKFKYSLARKSSTEADKVRTYREYVNGIIGKWKEEKQEAEKKRKNKGGYRQEPKRQKTNGEYSTSPDQNTSVGDTPETRYRDRRLVKGELIDDKFLYYEFVGESYIHGMMDEEAIREQYYYHMPPRDQVFELR